MEEKWTKSTYQDQSGLCYHDHFDMDSNGKQKESGSAGCWAGRLFFSRYEVWGDHI